MSSQSSVPQLFNPPPAGRPSYNFIPWALAGAVIAGVVLALFFISPQKSNAPVNAVLPPAPYAANLVFSSIQLSQATSNGGQITYIDGQVLNKGPKTVTGATLQVTFSAFDAAQAPQLATTPLNLIRTHEPYIDTEPVSAEPLAPSGRHEFRLVFEDVSPSWNQQVPELRAIAISTR